MSKQTDFWLAWPQDPAKPENFLHMIEIRGGVVVSQANANYEQVHCIGDGPRERSAHWHAVALGFAHQARSKFKPIKPSSVGPGLTSICVMREGEVVYG